MYFWPTFFMEKLSALQNRFLGSVNNATLFYSVLYMLVNSSCQSNLGRFEDVTAVYTKRKGEINIIHTGSSNITDTTSNASNSVILHPICIKF